MHMMPNTTMFAMEFPVSLKPQPFNPGDRVRLTGLLDPAIQVLALTNDDPFNRHLRLLIHAADPLAAQQVRSLFLRSLFNPEVLRAAMAQLG